MSTSRTIPWKLAYVAVVLVFGLSLYVSRRPAGAQTFDFAVTPITAGAAVEGELEPGDVVFLDGTFIDYFSFDALQGQRLTVEARSADFDVFLILVDSKLNAIAIDDDSAGGSDARLQEFSLPFADTFLVGVNVQAKGTRTGAYTLSFDLTPPPTGGAQISVSPSEASTGESVVIELSAVLPGGQLSVLDDRLFFNDVDLGFGLLPLLFFNDEGTQGSATLDPTTFPDEFVGVLLWRVVTDDVILTATMTLMNP